MTVTQAVDPVRRERRIILAGANPTQQLVDMPKTGLYRVCGPGHRIPGLFHGNNRHNHSLSGLSFPRRRSSDRVGLPLVSGHTAFAFECHGRLCS